MSTNVQLNLLSGLVRDPLLLKDKAIYLELSIGEEQTYISSVKSLEESSSSSITWKENYHFNITNNLTFNLTLWDYDQYILNQEDYSQNILAQGQLSLTQQEFINGRLVNRQVQMITQSGNKSQQVMMVNLQFNLINDTNGLFVLQSQRQPMGKQHVQQVRHYQNNQQQRYHIPSIQFKESVPIQKMNRVSQNQKMNRTSVVMNQQVNRVSQNVSQQGQYITPIKKTQTAYSNSNSSVSSFQGSLQGITTPKRNTQQSIYVNNSAQQLRQSTGAIQIISSAQRIQNGQTIGSAQKLTRQLTQTSINQSMTTNRTINNTTLRQSQQSPPIQFTQSIPLQQSYKRHF